jgi:cell division protein FtsX
MVCQHVFSGIRLAIGALERKVLTQFLVEAAVLSSFGGLIGIVLALAGSPGFRQCCTCPSSSAGGSSLSPKSKGLLAVTDLR